MGTLKRLVLCIILFPTALFAQTKESGSVVAKTNEGLIISQIILFPAVPGALRYEVEIEEQADGDFFPLMRKTVETSQFEVTLKAGSYRYRYIAFNRMNLPDGISEWQEFNVRLAIQPTVETYQPFYGLYYEMSVPSGILMVTGGNFSVETEFALVPQRKRYDWSGVSLERSKTIIMPNEKAVESDTHATLRFDLARLKKGDYDIFVRNPGGLWALLGQVRVGFRKNTDYIFAFGYSPMIAAFDYENALEETHGFWGWSVPRPKRQQLDLFNASGYYLRYAWIPIKSRWGNFGLGGSFYFLVNKIDQVDLNGIGGSWLFAGDFSGTMDLTYQKSVNRFQHNIRLGIGYGPEYHDGDRGDFNEYIIPFLLNMGYSAQYFVWKNLYAEAGIDFQFVLRYNHLMIRPTLGLGWQMGKWAEYSHVAEGARNGEDYSVPVKGLIKNEFTLSVGWYPMIPLYGIKLFEERVEYNSGLMQFVVSEGNRRLYRFNPAGGDLRAAYIPYRWGRNKLGGEFNMAILDYPMRMHDEGDGSPALMSMGTFGILYQRSITDSWQLNVRVGVGISHAYATSEYDAYNWYDGYKQEFDDMAFAFVPGISVQYFFWKNAYAEAGLDYVALFADKKRGMLRPGLFIGWQFNHNAETGLRLKGLGFPRSVPKNSAGTSN